MEHDGKSTEVDDARTVCAECGSVFYVGEQISRHERTVADAIRMIDGLLTPTELERIRTKYKLRQSDMEQMLSTGPKTWTRWERGKIPQSKATDKLIRLIAEDPEIASRLMRDAGVENPEAEAVFRHIEEQAKIISQALLRAELEKLVAADYRVIADRASERAFECNKIARQRAAVQTEAA